MKRYKNTFNTGKLSKDGVRVLVLEYYENKYYICQFSPVLATQNKLGTRTFASCANAIPRRC